MTKKACVVTDCKVTGKTCKVVGEVARAWFTPRKPGSQNIRCKKHRRRV